MNRTKATLVPYRDVPADDGASMSSAMSLQENIGTLDPGTDEGSGLPPYTDEEHVSLVPQTTSPPADLDTKVEDWRTSDSKGSRYIRLSPTLTADPEALQKYIEWAAARAPTAQIRIRGHHHETRRERDNKTKKEEVVDFDFHIDVTDTISQRSRASWNTLEVVPNQTKAYRGTRIKRRNQNARADVELNQEPPQLKEWCHLFCAASVPLKSFTVRRQIIERDEKLLTELIVASIRATKYRGNIAVNFPLHDRTVTIMSPHPFNRWRNNKWIWWACVLLQLWIIAWPVLWFMTKRWETVSAKWAYAKVTPDGTLYWSESERDWARRWGYSIQNSALSRVKDCVAIQRSVTEDQDRVNAMMRDNSNAHQTNTLLSHGSRLVAGARGGIMGGALALARGVANVGGDLDNEMGWGYDT